MNEFTKVVTPYRDADLQRWVCGVCGYTLVQQDSGRQLEDKGSVTRFSCLCLSDWLLVYSHGDALWVQG